MIIPQKIIQQLTVEQFYESLQKPEPPGVLNPWLKALWLDAKGEWEEAHREIQDLPDRDSAWIHAYLHRKEGDLFNANYWYRRAGKKRPSHSLQEEWQEILTELTQ